MQLFLIMAISPFLQVSNPEYSNYEQDSSRTEKPDSELEEFMTLVEEFIGIKSFQQGAYRWLELNETLLTTLEKWRQRPYFCPYRPYHGKWILTCKSHLQGVSSKLLGCV